MIAALPLTALDPGWIRDLLYRRAGQLPALDWWFARDRSLVDRIRGQILPFARVSGRTWVQANGTNGSLGPNQPAFIYRNGVSLGLDMREARTNLFLNTATPATQDITVTAVVHTLSFSGTGNITLSGVSTAGPLVGTGANQRVTLPFTPTAGSLTLTLSGTIAEPQLEAGGNASPFIPTTGLPAQRTPDICTLTDLSAIDLSGGLIYAEWAVDAQVLPLGTLFFLDDGTALNRVGAFFATASQMAVRIVRSGVSANPGNVPHGSATSGRSAIVYRAGEQGRFGTNGTIATAATALAGSVPATQLAIGANLNGTLARLMVFPQGPALNNLARLIT